jgi:hypothetical protein
MHFSDEGYSETLVATKKAGQRYDTQGHLLLQKENEKKIIFEARIAYRFLFPEYLYIDPMIYLVLLKVCELIERA